METKMETKMEKKANFKNRNEEATTASMSFGHEVDEALDNLNTHADEVREKEYRLRESRRELEYAKDIAKQALIENNVLDALKIDMNFIRKHSRN